MFECGEIKRWVLATLSFATDLLYILPVAKSSIATIAAVATDDMAVAKLSVATVAAVATD
jgi:hypothetical protein